MPNCAMSIVLCICLRVLGSHHNLRIKTKAASLPVPITTGPVAGSEFNNIAKNPDLDLYPEDLRSAIDEVNSWVYPTINNGVYRSGFATTQKAYETAFR